LTISLGVSRVDCGRSIEGEFAGLPVWRVEIEVRLLGPFEVAHAGQTLHIGSPKQRAVLALLALQAGRVVSADALCDLIWDEDQPASPSATLQSLISRLRASLAAGPSGVSEGGREALRTREPGWVLDIEAADVDALRFHELTSRARRRRERGEMAAAGDDLAEAIGLWRGAALLDVVDAGYLAGHATRLNEARLDAVEDLAEVELAIGRPGDALTRLEAHVDANPLRERAWGVLMVALYRLGRQAAALAAFQQLRGILGDQLGIQPAPELARIEQQILRHDPALAGPDAGSSPPASGASSVEAGPAGEFAEYHVVVVEDHDFQRRTVVQLLKRLGVGTVTEASNGVDALDLLQSGRTPDIVICDIDMPGMDGVEFVTRVAEANLACSVVIASGLESNVLRAVEAIGSGHGLNVLAALPKPLTARRLGEVLSQYTRLDRDGNQADNAVVDGAELREAFERDDLRAQLEPRIDLTTGAFSSAEVSGRWTGPGGIPVPSAVLIPAVAREGLLLPFVERLVGASCAFLDEVEQAGLDDNGLVRVALDISALLLDASLADRLSNMVHNRDGDPRRFVCQLDEGALNRAPPTSLAILTRLRVKGFGLSITHSGVGPAWTNQLGRVPMTELKLERSLVSGATSDPKRLQVLEAAVAAARDSGLPTVADGCDAQVDFDMLLALGCSEAQGAWVAKPVEAADVVAWANGGILDASTVAR
jgi:DNA-binding SARP family transcriptional activator/EAL domain-containing protein (putative c-di-GMP-specific phosphodiesterase class I)/FixJ family two-component response regulator